MSEIVTIGTVKTSVIHYKSERVCTTQQLAKLYGVAHDLIHDNHRKNRARFEEGKHFIKLVGAELREFIDLQPEDFRSQISSKTRSLSLWTERGAMRHAKMLESEAAWEVFEEMEDTYFSPAKPRALLKDGEERSSKFDRLPLYHFVVDTTIRHHLIFSKVYLLVNLFAGSKSFKDMTKEQTAAVADFCDRFALGQDTRNDWQRIADNQAKLHGTPAQLDMVQKLLLS